MTPRRPFALPIGALLLVPVLTACGSSGSSSTADVAEGGDPASADDSASGAAAVDAAGGPALPEPILWPAGPELVAQGALVDAHPEAFARISSWITHVEGPIADRPDVGHRGAHGVGNGHTFALVGLADPLNAVHGLTTPTYERGARFFGDYGVRLAAFGEEAVHFDEEWTASALSSPVVLHRGVGPQGRLDIFDLAPWGVDEDAALRSCLVRVLELTTPDGEPRDLVVRAENSVQSPSGAELVELTDERALLTTFLEPGAGTADGKTLRVTVSDGARAVLVHCGSESEEGVEPVPPATPTLDVAALVEGSRAAWSTWWSGLIELELPDPRMADFLDGMKRTLKLQTSAQGATCPMSQYTRTWARDNIGPVLAMLAFGGHEDVEGYMDYLYGAVLKSGDLANSYDADLDLRELPEPPEWDALPPLSSKVASETPSYMVWIYGAHYLHSGEIGRAEERWGFLKRALFAQALSPEGLLPFTGDETFRTAMNVVMGLALEYAHHDLHYSANSSLLWLGAERHFQRLAQTLGAIDQGEAAAETRDLVEAGFHDTFVRDDDCSVPYVDQVGLETLEGLAPHPFEDVALKAQWAGGFDDDDSFALNHLACLIEAIGDEERPGRLQSPLATKYVGHPLVPVEEGIYTGMLPGYALSAYTRAGHADAEAALNEVAPALSSSGNLQEYLIADDDSGLTLLYDPSGTLTDYTAKFRPWEGGIVAHAVLDYLLGFEPDRPGRHLGFRPHLPNHWPSFAVRGLRAGDIRFDVQISAPAAEGEAPGLRITSHDPVETWTLDVRRDGLAEDVHGALLEAGATLEL